MNKERRDAICSLLFFVLVLFLYHTYAYIGHYGYDDIEYARLANNFLINNVDYNNHFSYRLPVIIFTALSYSLFGISDFASSLPPLLVTISILIMVYLVLKSKGYLTLITGLALTTFSNWFIFYSDKLMPDIYVAFSVMLSLFILNRYKFYTTKSQPFIYSFLFAIVLFFGFAAKETIVLIIPLLVYFIINDFINRRELKFWGYSFINGTIILLVYFLITWMLTGNFASRLQAITQNSYLNLCSYNVQSFQVLMKRVIYELFALFISHAMFTGFLFVIAFIINKRNRKIFQINEPFSFYLVSSVLLLLSSNFMSISLSSYNPMCLDVRHYLFLIPVVAIPASIIITAFIKTRQYAIEILVTLIVIAVVSYFIEINVFWKLYFPLIILIITFFLIRKTAKFQIAFIFIFCIILALIPFDMVKYAREINYIKQKEILFKYILNNNEKCYVLTNDVQKRLGEYYGDFNDKSNCKFLNFMEVNPDTLLSRKKYLLLNRYTQYLSALEDDDLPYYAKYIDSSNALIYEDKKLGIFIYEMNNMIDPYVTGNEIYNSANNFEKDLNFWHQNNAEITKDAKYEGINSYKVSEYSSTFEFPMDSLLLSKYNHFIASTEVYCNFDDETKSNLIITIEANDSSYFYQSKDINKYLKAYSTWWPVKFDVEINRKNIKASSILKIYLWNIDKRKA